jgi:hypothetical protein
MAKQPTVEQLRALIAWAKEHPDNWKAALQTAWMTAGAGVRSYSPELQQLRNGFGEGWLQRQTLGSLEAKLALQIKQAMQRSAQRSGPVDPDA